MYIFISLEHVQASGWRRLTKLQILRIFPTDFLIFSGKTYVVGTQKRLGEYTQHVFSWRSKKNIMLIPPFILSHGPIVQSHMMQQTLC